MRSDLDAATLDGLTDDVLDAVAHGERVGPAALLLLLRRYASGARPDVAEPLGVAMARELEREADARCEDDPEEWLVLFSEGAALSEDPRLAAAAASLVPAVQSRWLASAVDAAMHSIEASLRALNVPEARASSAAGIDAIERVIAGAYRPGAGVSHQLSGTPFVRGRLADHVRSSSALLTAYALSGRLPYAMLADELMQSVLRVPVVGERNEALAIRCGLASVFCRLAALHRDEQYRHAAVLAPDCDYGREAGRTLAIVAQSMQERNAAAAPFGLALAEWLAL